MIVASFVVMSVGMMLKGATGGTVNIEILENVTNEYTNNQQCIEETASIIIITMNLDWFKITCR